jgi:hypothetical protein
LSEGQKITCGLKPAAGHFYGQFGGFPIPEASRFYGRITNWTASPSF